MNPVNSAAAVAGWHPDPTNTPGTLRWWDGTRWTEHTRPIPMQHEAPAMAPRPATSTPYTPTPPAHRPQATESVSGRSQPSMLEQNSTSFLAIGVVIGYLVLAATTGVVLLGIFPVILSINAIGKGEKLAPLAMFAAALAVAFALGLLG
jgi:hypothetical protein